jgi:desulfoferrodoxin (superoxide reductase-like protein)
MRGVLYIVISYENFCVHTCSHNLTTANALACSSIDCFVQGIFPQNPIYNQITSRNFFYDKIWKSDGKDGLTEIDKGQVSETWLNEREVIRLRQELFGIWEGWTNNALARVESTKWSSFSVVAQMELEKCDIKNNKYTPMIEEYARAREMDISAAVAELSLQVETEHTMKFRITALAEKYKDKINKVTTRPELREVGELMHQEFWGNCTL